MWASQIGLTESKKKKDTNLGGQEKRTNTGKSWFREVNMIKTRYLASLKNKNENNFVVKNMVFCPCFKYDSCPTYEHEGSENQSFVNNYSWRQCNHPNKFENQFKCYLFIGIFVWVY